MSSTDIPPRATHPFQHDFVRWRAEKLSALDALTEPPLLRVSSDESVVHWGPKAAQSLFTHGFVRYSSAWAQLAEGRGDNVEEERAQSDWLQEFCLAFGLRTQERSLFAPKTGFTRLTVGKQGSGGYSPFSNRPLGWHTDGYTSTSPPVRSFVLHCISPAPVGGETYFLDAELVCIHLFDHYRSAFDVLTRPIMQIPANRDTKAGERAAVTACVIDLKAGLPPLVRYTNRRKHVTWLGGSQTEEAVDALRLSIDELKAHWLSWRLDAGEGVVSANALHKRTPYDDAPGTTRLLLRGRFAERPRAPTSIAANVR